MLDRPDASALLGIVSDLLRGTIIPQLDEAAAYQARMANNVIRIVQRELDAGNAVSQDEGDRLRALLSVEECDLTALNMLLAARLREGALAADSPGVADHLWITTLAKLSVDQPGFARYRAILGR